jgi:DMSO/TMAO reductase YedYZ molybdopterin-dependent catalytic subunit
MPGKFFQKAKPEERDRVPPGQYLAQGFPILTYGEIPSISTDDWELRVWGLAAPQTFPWSEMMSLPQQELTQDFHCVTRWSKLDVTWTGIKIADFMDRVELDPRSTHVMQHCYGGYRTNVPLDDFVREESFFVFALSGEPLPAERGGPMRTLIPHLYAWKSAKWINGIEFLDREQLGFWERNGYHRRGDPWAEERYSD